MSKKTVSYRLNDNTLRRISYLSETFNLNHTEIIEACVNSVEFMYFALTDLNLTEDEEKFLVGMFKRFEFFQ